MRTERWTISVCKCGRLTRNCIHRGEGHEDRQLSVVPASDLATAKAEIEELKGERDDYAQQLFCPNCEGSGEVMRVGGTASPNNPDGEYDTACPDCKGTGRRAEASLQTARERIEELEGSLRETVKWLLAGAAPIRAAEGYVVAAKLEAVLTPPAPKEEG